MARSKSATLTEAELRIMNVLWERGSATVHEVLQALPAKAAAGLQLHPDDRAHPGKKRLRQAPEG